jgi:hypothetical protein
MEVCLRNLKKATPRSLYVLVSRFILLRLEVSVEVSHLKYLFLYMLSLYVQALMHQQVLSFFSEGTFTCAYLLKVQLLGQIGQGIQLLRLKRRDRNFKRSL